MHFRYAFFISTILAFCLLPVTACNVDWSVPPGSQIECASDQECPPAMVCRGDPGTCIPVSKAGTPAPAIVGDLVVSSSCGTLGTELAFSFTVDQPLRTDPMLVLDAGSRRIPLTIDELNTDRAALLYAFTYVVDGSELAGNRPLLATLEGEQGAAATDIAAGSVTLDFAAPRLAGLPSLTRARLAPGVEATLSFDLTEAVSATPVLAMTTSSSAANPIYWEVSGSGSSFVGTFTPLGIETQDTYSLQVVAADGCGNASDPMLAGSIVLDFEAPQALRVTSYLTPDSENPLFVVSALRNGAALTVSFDTDEVLEGVPEVHLLCGDLSVPMARRAGQDAAAFFTYELTLSASHLMPDGECTVYAELADVAGNIEDRELSESILVDRTAPVPAESIHQAFIRHSRFPQGAQSTLGDPGHFLTSTTLPSGADPLLQLIDAAAFHHADADIDPTEQISEAHIYSDADRESLIGIVRHDDSGSWIPVKLIGADAVRIWATVLDRAGNESLPALVQNGTYVMTAGRKEAGSQLSNPNYFGRTERLSETPARSSVTEVGANSGVDAKGGTFLSSAGAGYLEQLPTALAQFGFPDDNVLFSRVVGFDSESGAVVSSTGAGDGASGTMFEFAAGKWRHLENLDPELDGNPKKDIRNFASIYDPVRDVIVLVGGVAPSGCDHGLECNATWEWNGTSWRRRELGPDKPGSWSYSKMTYDSLRRRIMMFGGFNDASGTYYDGLWAYDGTSWTQLCGTGVDGCHGPEPRGHHGFAYDSKRDRLIVYGGYSPSCSGNYCRDSTWEWYGTPPSWHEVTTSSVPTAYSDLAMTFDENLGKTVIFGGYIGGPIGTNETWAYDGINWERLFPYDPEGDGVSPPATRSARLVWEPAHSRVLAFVEDGLWQWRDLRWTNLTPPTARPSRLNGLVYDTHRRKLVALAAGMTDLDVWERTGWQWSLRCRDASNNYTCSGGPPTTRAYSAAAFDAHRGRTVVFSGRSGDVDLSETWEWTGSSWVPGPASPVGRSLAGAVFDPNTGRVLVFGGEQFESSGFNDLLSWTGASWDTVPQPADRPAAGPHLVFLADPESDKLVLFGGSSTENGDDPSIYAWNGSTWADETSDAGLQLWPLTGAYSALRGKMVVLSTYGSVYGLYEWDGTAWVDAVPSAYAQTGLPFPLTAWRQMAPTAGEDPLLIVGDHEEWLWHTGAVDRPGVRADLSFGPAGLASDQIQAIGALRVRWDAAAQSAAAERDTLALRLEATGTAETNIVAEYGSNRTTVDSLATLVGRNPNRLWTLLVQDTAAGTTGTLNSWSLNTTIAGVSKQYPGAAAPIPDPSTTGGVAISTIDLTTKDLGVLENLTVSVDITHGQAQQLQIALFAGPARSSTRVDGAALLLWDTGRWRVVDGNSADPTVAPSAANVWTLDWATSDADTIRALLSGSDKALRVAAAPVGFNGTEQARIAADYIEAEVRYVLKP